MQDRSAAPSSGELTSLPMAVDGEEGGSLFIVIAAAPERGGAQLRRRRMHLIIALVSFALALLCAWYLTAG